MVFCPAILEILIILFIHAWVRPHKNKWHNVMDSFIFTLLAVMNGITILNYQNSLEDHSRYQGISSLGTIQVIISGTPIVMLLGYILYYVAFVQKLLVNKLRHFSISNKRNAMQPMARRRFKNRQNDLSLCEGNSREGADYNEFSYSSYSETA